MVTDGGPNEIELRAVLDRLLRHWTNDGQPMPALVSKVHAAQVCTIYGLTAHAHRLGAAVAALQDASLVIESVPIIRAGFEAAFTAAWIQQVPDALPAYLNRNHAQQRALRDTVLRAGWASQVGGSTAIPADTAEPYIVTKQSDQGAKRMQDLCGDLLAGAQGYSTYRALSWMTHPTAAVCDLYVHLRDDEAPMLLRVPKTDEDINASWLHLMCSALVWSGRALNLIDQSKARAERRRFLREMALGLKIAEFLRANPDAIDRGRKSERARQRAQGAVPAER